MRSTYIACLFDQLCKWIFNWIKLYPQKQECRSKTRMAALRFYPKELTYIWEYKGNVSLGACDQQLVRIIHTVIHSHIFN